MKTAWAVLGIAPTRDRSAVRRAYAAKLKVTNPEDDPEGFQELRQAYELVLAQLSLPEMAETEPAERLETAALLRLDPASMADAGPEPATIPEVAEPDLIAQHWEACRRLHEWIVEQRPPAEDADLALAQLLASPAMENLSVRAETERGLAHTILNLAPYADGLIGRCTAFFGWEASVHHVGAMPEARAVMQRSEALRFALELRRKSHAHHRAYELMKRPPPSGLAAAAAVVRDRGNIRDFFAYASKRAPGIFREFPRESVDFWARHGGNSKPLFGRWKFVWRFRGFGFSLFMIYLFVRIVIFAGAAGMGTGNEPPAPPSSMEMRTSALAEINDRALEELKSGAVTKAHDDYDFALGQSPYDPEALFGRGVTRVLKGDDAGNADKLAAVQRNPGIASRFASPNIPAAALIVFDTAPNIIKQPFIKPVLPAGALKTSFSIEVRCLVGIDGRLHECASRAPVPSSQEALAKAAIKYLRSAKVSPGRYRGAPVADAPVLLNATIGPGESRP